MKFNDYVSAYEKLSKTIEEKTGVKKDLCERFFIISFCVFSRVHGRKKDNWDIIENFEPEKIDDEGDLYYNIEGVIVLLSKED